MVCPRDRNLPDLERLTQRIEHLRLELGQLRQDDKRLRTARGWFSNLGDYYVLDFKHNRIVKGHVDPEALGRDLAC